MSGLGTMAFLQMLQADAQKAAVQLENSQILNEFAKQELRDGDPVTAILLVLEALPDFGGRVASFGGASSLDVGLLRHTGDARPCPSQRNGERRVGSGAYLKQP